MIEVENDTKGGNIICLNLLSKVDIHNLYFISYESTDD